MINLRSNNAPFDASLTQDQAYAPFISVIIPFYKQEAYLAEAVASVRAQTYRHYEVIVVDDGSPISAASILSEDPRVALLRTANLGVSAARNTGAALSRGDFLLFLDSDDTLTSNAFEVHLKGFALRPDASLSFGAIRYIDSAGEETRASHICQPRQDYFPMLLESNPNGNPGANLLRRSLFADLSGFDESLSMAEDYDFWLRAARDHTFVRSTDCVLSYRFHETNTTRDTEGMLAATLLVLDRLAGSLTNHERRRLAHGKRRWRHAMTPRAGLFYRLADLYYSARAMLTVAPHPPFRDTW